MTASASAAVEQRHTQAPSDGRPVHRHHTQAHPRLAAGVPRRPVQHAVERGDNPRRDGRRLARRPVPADADAVTLNVTVTQTNAVSYLSIWPKGETQPTVSSLNWDPGWTVPELGHGQGRDRRAGQRVQQPRQRQRHRRRGRLLQGGRGCRVHVGRSPSASWTRGRAFQVGPYNTPWEPTTNRDVTVAGRNDDGAGRCRRGGAERDRHPDQRGVVLPRRWPDGQSPADRVEPELGPGLDDPERRDRQGG